MDGYLDGSTSGFAGDHEGISIYPTGERTGYILEKEALEIEAGCNAAIRSVLGAEPMASGWSTAVHRDDNILTTKTMNVDVRLVPLGYVEFINEIGRAHV